LTYWSRSSSGGGSIHTQAWPINYGSTGLSLVGDWTTVNINGVTQSRTHNAVHELLTINSTGLTTMPRATSPAMWVIRSTASSGTSTTA
jgi:hypothetical protein